MTPVIRIVITVLPGEPGYEIPGWLYQQAAEHFRDDVARFALERADDSAELIAVEVTSEGN